MIRSTHGGIVNIIKKDQLSVVFRRCFIRVEAAVQLGIAAPPLSTLRPGGLGPYMGKTPRARKRQEGPKYSRVFSVKRCWVQEGPKYRPDTKLSFAYIIKKDRLSTCYPTHFIRVAAAVRFGIAFPPLPSIRPVRSVSPCKKLLSTVQVLFLL